MPGILPQGAGETGARGNIVADVGNQLLKAPVLKAVSHNVETLNQRYASFHHGGELACKHGDVERRDLFAAAKQGFRFLLHLVWNNALLTQLGLHQGQVGARHLALGFVALAVFAFPDERLKFLCFLCHA